MILEYFVAAYFEQDVASSECLLVLFREDLHLVAAQCIAETPSAVETSTFIAASHSRTTFSTAESERGDQSWHLDMAFTEVSDSFTQRVVHIVCLSTSGILADQTPNCRRFTLLSLLAGIHVLSRPR